MTAEKITAPSRPDSDEAPDPEVALRAQTLYRFFHAGEEETLALRGVTFTVSRGEFVAVVGPSGSGKSTLLSCLAGLDEPDGGSVRVAGERMSHQPEQARSRLRAARVGLLFQHANLLEHLTLRQNVALVRKLAGNGGSGRDLLSELGLAERAGAYPSALSGGESARAGLAVALANDPDVLLADEPTGELDSDREHEILGLLGGCAERGVAILVASHSRAVAEAADRIIGLADGILAQDEAVHR